MAEKQGWWDSSILKAEPNKLLYWGYRIEDLLGRVSYGEMVYLMVKGELPKKEAGKLMDALLVAACDHGAVSPAVATSMMAATCGITFNSVIATGMNLLGKIHGGAVEEAMHVYVGAGKEIDEGKDEREICRNIATQYRENKKFVPGYGHPVHDDDPRVKRLFEMGKEVVGKGEISGKYISIANTLGECINEKSRKHIPLNVDAAVAALLCELELPPETAMGYICLSRGIGLMAHGYEEYMKGNRMKAPCSPSFLKEEMTYSGPPERDLPEERE